MNVEITEDFEDAEVTEDAGNLDALSKRDTRDFDSEVT